MLEQLINLINDSIKKNAIVNGYDANFYGLTELVPTDNDGTIILQPTAINKQGDGVKMSLDNTVGFQVYHRLNDKTPIYKSQQYGESNKEITDSYGLSMFVIGNRIKLKQDNSKLSQFVTGAVPDQFKLENKSIALLTQSRTDYNSNQIIKTEFQGYDGMPDLFMFRVDYNIRHTYRRKCLDVCETVCNNYSSN
jgi:hypothetical protein